MTRAEFAKLAADHEQQRQIVAELSTRDTQERAIREILKASDDSTRGLLLVSIRCEPHVFGHFQFREDAALMALFREFLVRSLRTLESRWSE